MLNFFFRIRFMAVLAVIASLLGAFLLFLIGGFHVLEAFQLFLGLGGQRADTQAAIVFIIESVDNFLLAYVLLYFAYSTYFLFLLGERQERDVHIPMPGWMQVRNLGQMKKVLLEVILVLIAVYLLKLLILEGEALTWTVLIIPLSILAIALSLKLVHFDD